MEPDSSHSRHHARERISALVDAELAEHDCERTFRELAEDEVLCRTWERYHLIGACLRREPVTVRPELTARLARRLEEEPVRVTGAASSPAGGERTHNRLLLPLAVAASVAVLVAGGVALQQLRVPPRGPDVASSAAVGPSNVTRNVTRWTTADPGHEATLNALLVEHSEFTSPPGMNGLASYAKFVSYDSAP